MSTTVSKTSSLKEWLEGIEDLERGFDLLRLYKKERVDEIKREDFSSRLPGLFEKLTVLAEEVLGGALLLAHRSIGRQIVGSFAIVAMGKFGGRELGFTSDLDLLYLYENPKDQEAYTRLGQRIITALIVPTRYGVAFQIDTALRPSGNAGTLVSSLASFEDYHRTMAQVWEKQSLIKARPILGLGDPKFLQTCRRVIEGIAYAGLPPSIAGEINRLRRRMEVEIARETADRWNLKIGRGGIVDIEFIVQYLQLTHGKAHPALRTPNTLEGLEALRKERLLEEPGATDLKEHYLFFRSLGTNLCERRSSDPKLWEELGERREKVRSLYERILG